MSNKMLLSDQAQGTMLVVSAAMTFAMVALAVDKTTLPSTAAAETRFFICWLLSMGFMAMYRRERKLHLFGPPDIRWALVLRGFLTCGFVLLWWAALPMAPLGDCIAVIYCSPLLTVIFSRVILGEKMLGVWPIQALLATAGMCLIIQPPWLLKAFGQVPAETFSGDADYTLAIVAMLFSAILPVATKQTKDASWIEVEHVTSFLAVFVMIPLMHCAKLAMGGNPVLVLPEISNTEVGLVILAGIGSFVGVAMQTQGYQMADPGKASMFCYLEIPFAYFLQLVCTTQDSIPMSSMIGSLLVLLACLLGAVARLKISQKEIEEKKLPLLA